MSHRQRTTLRLLAAVTLAVALGGAAVPAASGQVAAKATVAAAGPATAVPGFLIQTSAQVSDDSAVSKPGFNTAGWYPVGPRSTVYAGLLANGKYADPFYSTNMKNVPAADFKVPWWYRTDLTVTDTTQRTYLDFSGVLSKADVWVNGTKIADKAQVNGAYTRQDLDITAQVKAGTNSVAFKVYPNDPDKDLSMGWIDWAQTPPDQNMGIVRDVLVRRSGPVALRGGHVVTKLTGTTHADLTVKADVRNDSAAAVSATVSGTVAGKAISQTVSLAAKEKKTVTFPVAGIDNPHVWWPAGMGGQPLYDLDLSANVGGAASDTSHESFGVREVKSTVNSAGGRAYTINGRPLLIKGGGYSPDLFLRWNAQYAADKLAYVKDLGLNTVRLEGHIEPDEFFDLADRMGVLTLPGWECCDKWEGQVNGSEKGDPWTAADYPIAKASMTAEAERLRDHPSVISFLIGSDFAPDATIEKNYLDALKAADWATPIVPAASAKSSPQLGASGMKMNGPYDYVPPNYWYDKAHTDLGGAFGFNSETSAGPDIPTMDTLKRMMSSSELDTLWKSPSTAQYHRSSSSTFANLKLYGDALTGRYGKPASLDDFVRKAQLAQYENVRAEFESHSRNFSDSSNPSTGIIYWMLNSGWTSLHWQLFDAYLDQNGSYFGAKKANEPLHIQYSYDNKSVVVVNHNHDAAANLTASVKLYNLDGTEKFTQSKTGLSVGGDGAKTTALTIPAVSGLSTTYLAKLVLTDPAGKEVSRNVYWLSTKTDTLDWDNSDWYYTPTTSYADLTGLNSLGQVAVDTTANSAANSDGTTTTKVTLKNSSTGKLPAFFVDAHVLGAAGAPVLPVTWTDNQVSLWPGESATLTATYRTADLKGATPSVRVAGWNTGTKTVPANGTTDPGTPGTPADYQAEDATITSGVAESNHAGFTGSGFVNYDNATGSAVEFSVDAAAAGPADVVLRYANGTTVNRPMDVSVNGTKVASALAFGGTGNWDTWQTVTVHVTLTAGPNKIKTTATTANGGPNVDKITV
ncbi:glycosyl hydrolase 2 galactose-binding domain-containing protein [Amycolatopsis sp. NBC_01286]|uniref:glycosyl hydrolase 2 galactose-binding domain-containing protein n=1 Tax=Amycolatopsis sp. NBC_01286 TaxID=2903560 RepID=UPI002E161CE4|nr:carbohydrate-binding protein [Amycolatopsis sp. NBC_01286]